MAEVTPPHPALLRPYGVALVSSALALLLTLLLQPVLRHALFLPFFAAVMVSSFFGGMGPALVTGGLAILSIDYFFLLPHYSLATVAAEDFPEVTVFMLFVLLVSSLNLARSRAEAAVRRAHDELQEIVAQRTAELRNANEELRAEIAQRKRAEEVLAELERFAYVASHDLQEPLHTLNCFAELLAMHYRGKPDAAADQYIGFIVDGAGRMSQLISDLLAYSRVSSEGKGMRPTDCQGVFAAALANLQGRVQEAGAVVTHDPLPRVMADGSQLLQLFQNLIGNALKFRGDEPPCIHVSAQQNGGRWVLSVRDNGIGIDPQHAGRIFQVFQRLHSREEYPGTGMGLAICKKIVERHGGSIWVESQPGQGSAFYFTLPAATDREPKSESSRVQAVDAQSARSATAHASGPTGPANPVGRSASTTVPGAERPSVST